MENFKQLNLKEKVLESIKNINFIKPTYIQTLVIPEALKNKSLIAKGKTGSGKTHSYLIPIANKIEENNLLQVVVLTPTRELAMQTYQVAKEFFSLFKLKITLLVGGQDINKDNDKLNSTPNIIIGTPQKIKSLGIDQGLINFKYVNTLIIDEADMTFELGFLNEVDKICSLIAKNAQIMVFSATIPVSLRNFLRKYMKKPLMIEDDKNNDNQNIKHLLIPIRGRNIYELLIDILNNINPYVCLIFANTKEEVETTYKSLLNNDFDVSIIHGDLPSRERKRNIKNALEAKHKFIVASDIAARGIDIVGVSHVISLSLPKNNLEFYTHRAGRCGRNNLEGICICLYKTNDKESILKLEKQGIDFQHCDFKNGNFKELSPFSYRSKHQKNTLQEVDLQIKKVIAKNKNKKVKPNYKKKVKLEIEKIKRKHKREIIKKDIKKRQIARAIEKTKQLKEK